MAEPINLRLARKARDRAEKRRDGEANAAKFGRTKADRIRQKKDKAEADRHLDGHRRDRPD